jgi:alkylhydroperoxidase family enzyme
MAVVSRVEPPGSGELPEFFESVARTSSGLGVLNVFKAMAHTPELMYAWWDMMMVALTRLPLDAKLRELAILRLFLLLRCDYGFAHHVRIGKRVGVSDAQIDALAEYESSGEFSEVERLVLRYTDAVTRLAPEASALAAQLRDQLSERDLVELTFCIANWNLMARLLMPLEVEVEEGIAGQLPAWWGK